MRNSLFSLFSLTIPVITATVIPELYSRDGSTQTFNTSASSGPSLVDFISGRQGLDGPKLSSVNSSVFDWWYFDAVSEDQKSSFVLIFFTSTYNAFPFLQQIDNVLPVYMWISFPNGTVRTFITHAERATIKTCGDGSDGKYEPIGMGWNGAPDLSSYLVTVDNADLGVKGTFRMNSIAPPHYPSGPAGPDMNMEIVPHVGWANAIPDGDGKVDMVVHGSRLKFKGSAYHDKNWSDRPFYQSSKTWYWGHTRAGPYSVVWLYAITPQGTEHGSGYISKDGKILHSGSSALKVFPMKLANDNYNDEPAAPTPEGIPEGLPEAFRVEFYSGSRSNMGGKQPLLALDVEIGQVIAHSGVTYARWVGKSTGCIFHQCGLNGSAVLEQILRV